MPVAPRRWLLVLALVPTLPLASAFGHAGADLDVELVSIAEPALTPWDPRAIVVDVTNVGVDTSHGGTLRVGSWSRGSHYSCWPIGETPIAALAPGETARFEGTWDPGLAVGTVTIRAEVLAGAEAGYGNNHDERDVAFGHPLYGLGRQGCGPVSFH